MKQNQADECTVFRGPGGAIWSYADRPDPDSRLGLLARTATLPLARFTGGWPAHRQAEGRYADRPQDRGIVLQRLAVRNGVSGSGSYSL